MITQELFNNLNFDTQTAQANSSTNATSGDEVDSNPSALIVFADSDINAAIYHLIKSLNSPFDAQAIATVLLQESVKKDFIEKLLQQAECYKFNKITTNERFSRALETAKALKAECVVMPHRSEETTCQRCIVSDFSHEQLGPTAPSGIVTLHTFRTAKEAVTLVNKESLQFTNVSIWHENHGHAYELVSLLKSRNFFINCHLAPLNILQESISQRKNYVVMHKSYHYETMQHDGIQKSIVFPIGSIFAN